MYPWPILIKRPRHFEMNKIIKFLSENLLFSISLFLLAFIPLYPKRPVVNVVNTWVYIRGEDFVVALTILAWIILFFRKKVSLKTPLTMPILLYWIVGGIATLHGVLLIFPTVSNIFSNVAFLSFARRIEYMSLFFVAYEGFKDKISNKVISTLSVLLSLVLLAVVAYGFGQHFLGFPAYLTMNEEFAKGIPIRLSSLSRVPSTFGGQYDLAAYLVLIIPIIVSLFFGFKNWLIKFFFLASAALGFGLLFLTVSRVSFFVLLISLIFVLAFQKKKIILISIVAVLLPLLIFSPRIIQRFGSTVSEIDVLVNAKSGYPIGQVKEIPASYFADKIILRQNISEEDLKSGKTQAIFPPTSVPPVADLVLEPNNPNGESLPQGTSYINLPLSPVFKKTGEYFYQNSKENPGTKSNPISVIFGDYVIKKAKAYDLSFTTRFQGEWPRTIASFQRNIFLGSGFGSVSLAVDNDYLRLLGETGIIGFISFLSIFLITGIFLRRTIPKIDSPIAKSFVLGFAAGTIGLILNAVLIDVFEASKIAFVYWLLMGISLAILGNYNKLEEIYIVKQVKKVITSPIAIAVYLFTGVFSLFSVISSSYFVGDDFTWFRWVADCGQCKALSKFVGYFFHSNGFFYRPGTKLYFDMMYSSFWLNQTAYHLVSMALHFLTAVLVFFIAKKIFKNYAFGILSAVVFIILSGYTEVVVWTAGTGHLFNAFFALFSLFLFIIWREKEKRIYFVLSLISFALSLLFHELGVIVPFLIILYDKFFGKEKEFKIRDYRILFLPIIPYVLLRFVSQSHWFNGDYSYNLLKLPFNIAGNIIGYLALSLFGPASLAGYEKMRTFSKSHVLISIVGILIIIFFSIKVIKKLLVQLNPYDRKIVVFGFWFFIISLLPFIGLGNITSRYSYLASIGFVFIFVIFLKKAYEYLLPNGKQITIALMTIMALVFSCGHLFQTQKIENDWNDSGLRSQKILISLDYIYAHYSSDKTSDLYFVNVPIKSGDAWLFPVGLSDAVWLVFRNNDIKVHQVNSVEQAFNIKGDKLGLVFEFDQDKNLLEIRKKQSGALESIKLYE